MTNLCNSCANIRCEFQSGIVRTKCAFYMPPTVEVIPKADYENRLKADMAAILDKIRAEIETIIGEHNLDDYDFCSGLICARKIIDKYKAESGEE